MAGRTPPAPAAAEGGDPSTTEHRTRLAAQTLGAVGVVFGDIGTSPLYTLQTAAETHPGGRLDRADVFGVISLVLWALTLAVSVKYVGFVMRADNRGEGGILALLSLLPKPAARAGSSIITLLVIAGASLLFGDGMITPAISVLSALEGLKLAAPHVERFVVPLTCAVLVGLFALQRRGTASVGRLFGPIMIAWFATMAVLGAKEVARDPEIVGALSPYWGGLYFARHGFRGLAILGVVVLAITGGEALYADMGHFGARAIRLSWFGLVFPALSLSYLGQGALVLRDPDALGHPLFSMVPRGPLFYGLVALATAATTIASQALISGVFSLAHQAVQLGLFPRVRIRHTSGESEGQIYVPLLNWGLMIACVALVLGFGASARLASAYGIAVSGTMAITSVVFFQVTRQTWHWPPLRGIALLLLFLSFDIPFLAANLTKFADGGYIPILVGVVFFVIMVDWRTGRRLLRDYVETRSLSAEAFASFAREHAVTRTPGTAIYLSSNDGIPHTLVLQADRIRAIMKCIVVVKVVVEHEPHVAPERRHAVEPRDDSGIVRVVIRFGYMDRPDVPPALASALATSASDVEIADATYFVARETLLAGRGGRMGPATEGLFAFLSRNARSAIDHFGLPPERVIELGTRIDL